MIMRVLNLFTAILALLAGVACADEATIREEITKKFPNANIESVTKTRHLGLYEVVVEGQLLYTDAKFSYMIDGSIIETATMTNVTADRQQELEQARLKKLAFPFADLPLNLAIKKVKGDGSRKIAVFSDPDCPFCRRLERDLEKVTDVTIYLFLYPIAQLHPKATEISRSIWCSPDRIKAWDDYMLRGAAPRAPGNCVNPVDDVVAFAQSKRITGTPTIFFADGKRVPGAIPAAQIEDMMAKAQATK